ncbi:MAG: EAL domain-containing protein [Gammaproteobacteria bacterium]
MLQLASRAIAFRAATEARFHEAGNHYEARVSAQGPDRALCVIRAVLASAPDDAIDATGERPRPELDRRGFLKRCKESMSLAALREKPIALAVIHLDEIPDISQVIAARVAEQVMSAAILRLSAKFGDAAAAEPRWYLGQLGENLLALVIESADRDSIEACVSQVCSSLREPVATGDSEFHLTPFAGVAVLGMDASTPKALLDHARGAAAEARRAFVHNVDRSASDAAIANAILSLGTSLNLVVTAEGIERPGQLEWLRARGCHEAQGFLLSRPLLPQDLETRFLRASSIPPSAEAQSIFR